MKENKDGYSSAHRNHQKGNDVNIAIFIPAKYSSQNYRSNHTEHQKNFSGSFYFIARFIKHFTFLLKIKKCVSWRAKNAAPITAKQNIGGIIMLPYPPSNRIPPLHGRSI